MKKITNFNMMIEFDKKTTRLCFNNQREAHYYWY